jgi:hypothetical protein
MAGRENCVAGNKLTRVYYGSSGAVVSKEVKGSIPCITREFPDDPLRIKPKFCWFTIDSAIEWEFCANNGGNCSLDEEGQIVRYGSGQKFVYRGFKGGVRCDDNSFGDPALGVAKTCYKQK